METAAIITRQHPHRSVVKDPVSACFRLEILPSWDMALRVHKCVSKTEAQRQLCFFYRSVFSVRVLQKHLCVIQTGWKFFSSLGTHLILPLAWRGIGGAECGASDNSFAFLPFFLVCGPDKCIHTGILIRLKF